MFWCTFEQSDMRATMFSCKFEQSDMVLLVLNRFYRQGIHGYLAILGYFNWEFKCVNTLYI